MAIYGRITDAEFREYLEKLKGERKELADVIATTLFLLEGPKDVWDVPEEGIYQEEAWTPEDYARWYFRAHARAEYKRFMAKSKGGRKGAQTTAKKKRDRALNAIALFDPKKGKKIDRALAIIADAIRAQERGEFQGAEKLPSAGRLTRYL